jgi:hypothetical protein
MLFQKRNDPAQFAGGKSIVVPKSDRPEPELPCPLFQHEHAKAHCFHASKNESDIHFFEKPLASVDSAAIRLLAVNSAFAQ